jgi:hypothetical protein
MRAIGSSLPRVDAVDKVTGATHYPGDIDLPGQAWLKIVYAGVPHARINAVDVRAALAAPGVIAVLTAADVPVNEYGLIMPDQPVLCGPGSTAQAETVRWEADHVAVVVAETEAQAEAAARLVQLDYTPLPVVTDPIAALQPGAPILHPHPFRFPYGERDLNSNLLLEYVLKTATCRRLCRRGRGGRGHLSHPRAGARLFAAGGRAGLRAPRRLHRGHLRRPVDARGTQRDRPRARPAPRTDRRALPGHRRRVRRARGYFGADRAGAGRVEDGPPGQDRLEPRGEHPRPPQAPPGDDPRQVGRHARRQDRRRTGGRHRRRRRLCLHQHQGAGQHAHVAARPLRDSQCGRDRAGGLHQQHAQRRVPRLWRPAGTLCRRDAGQQAGRSAGHGRL